MLEKLLDWLRHWCKRVDAWATQGMRKRYVFSMLILLSFWTFLGFFGLLESLLANAMLLDTYLQLGFLTLVNILAFIFCVAAIRLVNSRVSGGLMGRLFGNGTQPWTKYHFGLTTILAIISPCVLATYFATEFPGEPGEKYAEHTGYSAFSILLGLLLGWCVMWLIGWVKSLLFGSKADANNFFPFESDSKSGLFVSTWPFSVVTSLTMRIAKWFRIEDADLQFLAYLVFQAVVHIFFANRFSESESWWTSAPTLIIILLWIIFLLLAGLANVFDRYRLPVVAVLLVLFSIWLIPQGSTRPIKTVPNRSQDNFAERVSSLAEKESAFRKQPSDELVEEITKETRSLHDDAWRAIKNRMSQFDPHPTKGKTLVVVTCPGGGIHAAAWASCVLDQLCKEFDKFAESICVISGVSGGSTGTLFFVSNQYEDQLIGNQVEKKQATDVAPKVSFDLATDSSLEDIAYGIATDDLYKTIYPFLQVPGRGQRLENSWLQRQSKEMQKLSLSDWGNRAMEGKVPVVIFNSTDAVTGRRILFDSVPTPRRESNFGLVSRPINYRELVYVEKNADGQPVKTADVKPATAARTSATFPYVSPFTKPDRASDRGKKVALCDGGYADNEGIVTAVNWIDFILKRWQPYPNEFDRILLLRIEPHSSGSSEPGKLANWFRWLTGPAETMVNVRSTSQSERGNLESDLANRYEQAKPADSTTDDNSDSRAEGASGDVFQRDLAYTPQIKNVTATRDIFESKGLTQKERQLQWSKVLDDVQIQIKEKKINSPLDDATVDFQDLGITVSGEWTPEAGIPVEILDNQNKSVVVQRVQFDNRGQTIPLNWKLSKKQKLGYKVTWNKFVAPSIREEIKKYFDEK